MAINNCVSNWRTRLEKSIVTEENLQADLKQELSELRQKQRDLISTNFEKSSASGLTAYHKEILLNTCQKNLAKLKKQHRLHLPSSIIWSIETLNSSIAQKSSCFEQEILEASKEREKLIQKIAPVKEKVEIAKQFGGTTDAVQELEILDAELAKISTKLDDLKNEYRVFSVAKNHQNEACTVSEDTPGFQLRQLHKKLVQETESFAKDVETKRTALEQKIVSSLTAYISAIKELGELQATVSVKNLELQSIGKPEVLLISPIVMPKPSEDLNRLQGIFDGAASI